MPRGRQARRPRAGAGMGLRRTGPWRHCRKLRRRCLRQRARGAAGRCRTVFSAPSALCAAALDGRLVGIQGGAFAVRGHRSWRRVGHGRVRLSAAGHCGMRTAAASPRRGGAMSHGLFRAIGGARRGDGLFAVPQGGAFAVCVECSVALTWTTIGLMRRHGQAQTAHRNRRAIREEARSGSEGGPNGHGRGVRGRDPGGGWLLRFPWSGAWSR